MTDFFDRYGQQLIEASGRLAPSPSKRRRVRLGRRWSALVAGTALILAATAVAATEPWHPFLGDDLPSKPPPVTAETPPADQLDLLGVLRRQQTDRDRGPAAIAALRDVGGGAEGVRTNYVRVLASKSARGAVVLIPVTSYNPVPKDLPIAPRVTPNALCIYYPEPHVAGGAKNCFSSKEVRAGRASASLGLVQYGLVPDGVAIVTLTYQKGHSVSVPVRDNFYETNGPRESRDPELIPKRPESVVWADESGKQVGPPADVGE